MLDDVCTLAGQKGEFLLFAVGLPLTVPPKASRVDAYLLVRCTDRGAAQDLVEFVCREFVGYTVRSVVAELDRRWARPGGRGGRGHRASLPVLDRRADGETFRSLGDAPFALTFRSDRPYEESPACTLDMCVAAVRCGRIDLAPWTWAGSRSSSRDAAWHQPWNLAKPVLELRSSGDLLEGPAETQPGIMSVPPSSHTECEAVAALVDNALDACAGWIDVVVVHDSRRIQSLTVVDDGHGIARADFPACLSFGKRSSERGGRLSLHGTALKTASMSQVEEFVVASRHGGHPYGIRCDADMLTGRSPARHVRGDEIAAMFGSTPRGNDLVHGTAVRWIEPRFVDHRLGTFEASLHGLLRRLTTYLGTVFHRHLRAGRSIRLGFVDSGEPRLTGPLMSEVCGKDPYGAAQSTVAFRGDWRDVPFTCKVHVMPRGQIASLYKPRMIDHTGLYLYVGDRLVQDGGWRTGEAFPFGSANVRLELDLPAKANGMVTQEKRANLPESFGDAILAATSDGQTLGRYVESLSPSGRPPHKDPVVRRDGAGTFPQIGTTSGDGPVPDVRRGPSRKGREKAMAGGMVRDLFDDTGRGR